jgi:hypothetical protein
MGYGIVGNSNPGNLNQPSPSIFGDSPNGELVDEGQGFYFDQDFVSPISLPGMIQASHGAAGTYAYATTFDNVVSIVTAGAAADAIMLSTRPIASIASGNGKPFWAEVEVAFASVTAVQGFFFGLLASNATTAANATGTTGFPVPYATNDVKASYVSGSTSGTLGPSATRTSNFITTMSAIGFLGLDTSPQVTGNFALDAFYINQPDYSSTTTVLPSTPTYPTTAATLASFNYSAQPVTKGSVILVQADVTNSPSISANFPANQSNASNAPISQAVTTTIGGFPGNIQAYTTTSSTTTAAYNNGFVKLGLRYDGQQYLYWYVNGVRAARALVNGTFDQSSDYGVALSYAGNAQTMYIKRFRAVSNVVGAQSL